MWNTIACKPDYESFLRKKEEKRFNQSLSRIRPLINIKKPRLPGFFKSQTKKTRLIKEELTKIENSNKLMLKKFMEIDAKPSFLSKDKVLTRHFTAGSLNFRNRVKNQMKIMTENKKILERLQKTESFYSTEKWKNDYKFHNWIRKIHSKKKNNNSINKSISYKKFSNLFLRAEEFNDMKSNFKEKYNL